MKTLTRLLTLPVLILAAAGLSAATVNVTAEDAEKHRDIRISNMSEEASLEVVLDQIRDGLSRSAKRYLAKGQTLDIHFTDIDLAGEFEPWRAGPQYDIRWVKDIYIPRLDFTFKLTNADGTVVAEGEEKLRDMAFMMRANNIRIQNSAYYEVQMLNDWMRKFRKSDKS
jgi:hypothetical protein